MRPTLLLVGVVGFVATIVGVGGSPIRAAPIPKHLFPKDEPYCYMTRVGDRQESRIGDGTILVVVTKVEKTDEGLRVTTEQEIQGKRQPCEVVFVSARGIKVVEYSGNKLDEPFWWLKLPHTENNSWCHNWAGTDQQYRTAGWEVVEVPAGKVRAIRMDRTDGPGQPPTSYWWAPEMGCVKWSNRNTGREMTAFTSGK